MLSQLTSWSQKCKTIYFLHNSFEIAKREIGERTSTEASPTEDQIDLCAVNLEMDGGTRFDKFIESTDRDLNLDTSDTRVNVSISKDPHSVAKKEKGTDPKPQLSPRQLTPTRFHTQDHPLKDATKNVRSISRSNTLTKRRSLIQPIAVPTTPDYSISNSNLSSSTESRSYNNDLHESISQTSNSAKAHLRNSSSHSLVIENEASSFDISALLQNLANKELELLECKHRIEEMKKQLAVEEQDLQRKTTELQSLKEQASKHLNPRTKSRTPKAEESINGRRSAYPQAMSSPTMPSYRTPEKIKNPQMSVTEQMESEQSKSVWSRPLAIISQFDQIIQQELEKSLNWDDASPKKGPAQKNSDHQASLPANNLQHLQKPNGQPNNNSVTKSLWNFVSDMKAGLLGIEEEPAEATNNMETIDPWLDMHLKQAKDGPSMKDFKTAQKSTKPAHENHLQFVADNQPPNDNNVVRSDDEDQEALRKRAPVVEMTDFSN